MDFKRENIIKLWLVWHFYEMPKFLFMIWNNYVSFGLYYFSMPLLIKTLFSPWRRYNWAYPKGFNIGGYLSILISNLFSRIIGAICRLFLLIFGVAFLFLIIIFGALAILLWFLIPFIIAFLLISLFYAF